MTAVPIDRDIVAELRVLQGNRCGICGECKPLDLDHDHPSGMVRGLLCRACNVTEGKHGFWCAPGTACAICSWRLVPAVSWLGWTQVHRRPSDWFGSLPFDAPWGPTALRNGEAA